MPEKLPLEGYIPADIPKTDIELRPFLQPVVDNLSTVLPPEKIWDLYASDPRTTGGVINFPYCRVDNALFTVQERIELLDDSRPSDPRSAQGYDIACNAALKAAAWVEIGFEGLENFANSPASVSWTYSRDILRDGATFYQHSLQTFAQFRIDHGITDDCFTQNGAEDLLKKFESQR
jgi:hypothetical protein